MVEWEVKPACTYPTKAFHSRLGDEFLGSGGRYLLKGQQCSTKRIKVPTRFSSFFSSPALWKSLYNSKFEKKSSVKLQQFNAATSTIGWQAQEYRAASEVELAVHQLLRGIVVIRVHPIHKNLKVEVFSRSALGPDYHVPPFSAFTLTGDIKFTTPPTHAHFFCF